MQLEIITYREGPLGPLGHDLCLSAPVLLDEYSAESIRVEIDCRSFDVLGAIDEGTAEVVPIPKKHRREILKTVHTQILDTQSHPRALFSGRLDGSTLNGTLQLMGRNQIVRLDVSRVEGTLVGLGQIKPSHWGIKPYSTFFGALRVRDDVTIKFSVETAAK